MDLAFLDELLQKLQLHFYLRWQDVIDILIVAVVLYRLFMFIKDTRALQIFYGLLLLLLVFFFAQYFEFYTVDMILRNIFSLWVLVFLIFFQPELRRALSRVGTNTFFSSVSSRTSRVIEEIITTCIYLAEHKHGALIVVERDVGLRNYIETGVRINAHITSELLETIFHINTPLHDGAVIIKGDNIVAASCTLPLSTEEVATSLGTRHRAARGLSEESDAVVIVVSEETQSISIVCDTVMKRNFNAKTLRHELNTLLTTTESVGTTEEIA